MLRKIKKAIPAVISAILCVPMVLGVTVSAASTWSETKALTSGKYNSNYIKWVEKYSEKTSKNTISYSKSRTKKFSDKLSKAMNADEPQYSLTVLNKNAILSYTQKGNKIKTVAYAEDFGIATYITPKEIAVLDPVEKEKLSMTLTDDIDYDELMDEILDEYVWADIFSFFEDLGVADNEKGKYFKLKSGDNTYYYEEFTIDDYGKIGFLFNSNGSPLAMMNGDISSCITLSYKVKDSEFTVPEGYAEIDY
ncbi:MAG: hypothetical protein NC192_01290 [Muribaculaceae bacterium]|nr:hypothetical protein [Muribaculaceae bacterium]